MSNKNAFYDESTKTLTVTHADKESFGLFYDFKECKQLVLKEGIKELPGYCIHNFNEIEELILPDTLETLPCFIIPCGYASKNKRVHFGKGLKSISYDNPNYYEFEYVPHRSDLSCLKDIETVTIDPDNQCFKIENDLFLSKDGTILYAYIGKGCNELIIPKTVKEIKGHAFYDCHKIDKLIVPGTIKKIEPAFVYARIGELVFEEGVEEISDNAFLRSHIENIKFPKSIKKIGKHPFIGADGLKILRLYDGIEYKTSIARYSIISDYSSSAFWFNVNGKFNDLEFIEIYDKNDNLLRRYGLISDKEKNIKSEDPLSIYWIELYHEHLFRSIVGMELKKNAHELPENEQFAKSPLNFQYITDWRFFKDPITKNRFICGILPEINNIDDKSKRRFLNYAFENITDIYKMAQKNNFENVINILKNFPFEETKKQFSFEDYSEYDIKEKLDALHMYINSNGGYWHDIDDNAQIIVERYNNIFKDFIKKEN